MMHFRLLVLVFLLPLPLVPISGCAEFVIGFPESRQGSGARIGLDDRIPDFSYAGYEFGDKDIPSPPAAVDVTDFGARPDDDIDDTRAFQEAIARTRRGAIHIPPGRYLISDILRITKPEIVLRGAGSGETMLYVTTALGDIEPRSVKTASGRATSKYSWSGGFIWVDGWADGGFEYTKKIDITGQAPRGTTRIQVRNPEHFSVGQSVRIEVNDNAARSLTSYLYAGEPGDIGKLGKISARMLAKVQAIVGDHLILNRPLRWDLRPEWSPNLRVYRPDVHHVGVEGLTIEFPSTPYAGHFKERGRNGIAFAATAHCWIRDVVVRNCDSGVFFMGEHGTIDGLVIESDRQPQAGWRGHHGISLGSDNLLKNFEFRTRFIHDITITQLSAGNVIKNGRGPNLSFDHHKSANHANLFTDIDAGEGTDIWRSGGGASLGRHAGAWTTFWGIETDQPVEWPGEKFGPDLITVVGVNSQQPAVMDLEGRWFQPMDPDDLEPRDLHAEQLRHRRDRDTAD